MTREKDFADNQLLSGDIKKSETFGKPSADSAIEERGVGTAFDADNKGGSFGGCVRYVTGKRDAKLLAAEGVLLENRQSVIDSFEVQSMLNTRLGRKVGHISLNFSAQDAGRISDAFMLNVAGEYMQKMGIVDTQFIVVRHNDREHPHCHIVFNRVDNDGKTISDKNDRLRSVKACRTLTEKHGLYIAGGKNSLRWGFSK